MSEAGVWSKGAPRAQTFGAIAHAGLARPARAASDATDFFQIPTGRAVEGGTQVAV